MLENYFKIAIRNILQKRFYSLFNILCLSLGLTAVAIIILYTHYEISYDSQYSFAHRTVRISGKQQNSWFAPLSRPYSDGLYNNNFPEIEKIARIRNYRPQFIRAGNEKFYEEKVLITDPGSSFFTIFNLPFVKGNASAALKNPHAVVLAASVAQKIFGQNDPIGKAIFFDTIQLTVTGVLKDLPGNTHLDMKVLFTDENIMKEASGMLTYCCMRENTDLDVFKKKILALPKPRNSFSVIEDVTAIPLTRLHFEGNMTYEMKPAGNKLYLLIFNIVGIMIALLACVNYMNLSIAMYGARKKEIAVRKVVGAGNRALAIQFITESVCLSLCCLPVTIVLLEWMLPWFNRFMEVQLHNIFITSFTGAGLLLSVTLLIGIISGSYPAWVLPKLKAITLFRRLNMVNRTGLNLRKALVTFQITILVTVVSGSWIISNQLSYMLNKDLGFEKEGVLKLGGASMVDSAHYYTLKNELLKNPLISSVSQGYAPGESEYGNSFKIPGSDIIYSDMQSFGTDYDYLETLGIKLAAADFTDIHHESPRRLILINETMATRLGFKDPIGKKMIVNPGTPYEKAYTINGVIKDFHLSSFHNAVEPMMINVRPFGSGIYYNILVKVQTRRLPSVLDYIQKQTAAIITDIPINIKFLDENLDKMYDKEHKLSLLSRILLCVTLLLSISGLVGLAAFMTQLRTKEIGIRKVLGASVMSILRLLGSSFFGMAVCAMFIGCAISFFIMNSWLENFAYKVNLSWIVFAGTSASILLVILGTVFGHAIKAALANPIKALRTE